MLAGPGEGSRAGAPLIARRLLFGDPERRSVRISPNGTKIAFVAPLDGAPNIWCGPTGEMAKARPVTRLTDWSIGFSIVWLHSDRHLLYARQQDGDENWRIYCVDLETEESRPLTPAPGVRAYIQQVSRRFPTEFLAGHNARDSSLFDLFRIDALSGASICVERNERFSGFFTDLNFAARLATHAAEDGGVTYFMRDRNGAWRLFRHIGMEDAPATRPLDFSEDGGTLYWLDSRGRDTSAIVAEDIATGARRVLAEDKKADLTEVALAPETREPIAAASYYTRKRWHVLDPAYLADKDTLSGVSSGDLSIVSLSRDSGNWIVHYDNDDAPGRFYRYDRISRRVEFLFSARPALDAAPLVRSRPLVIKARDGLELVGYLSRPRDAAQDGPLPAVLLVHGGPWSRESGGYSSTRQWLADRGYAVLGVNFRGSTGFGKAFVNAANLEWGGKMHADLIDAVDWAIAEGIADPARVAIVGSSYGGYSALLGLVFTPDRFACGIDMYGIANLVTMLQAIPDYWKPIQSLFKTRVGDYSTEAGRRFLLERSPVTYVDRIRRPLLIAQGGNDVRVKPSESEQIVKAMADHGIPVTYVYYPDEGHGFRQPENRLSFLAVAEAFLAQHLGGRCQPIGDDLANSSIEFRAGRELIAGIGR